MTVRTNPTLDRTTCFLALALSMFGQACLDEDPTELPRARDAETREPVSDLPDDLG